MATKTLIGKEARDKVFEGASLVKSVVAPTMGARGRNGLFHRFGMPKLTNDGVTLARAINPEDPFLKMGADLMKETAEKTNDVVGDGTSTSIVLAHALLECGIKEIENNKVNPMALKKEIEEAVKFVDEKLVEVTRPIGSQKDLEFVANISVENEELGKKVAEAITKVGEEGAVSVELSSGYSTSFEEKEGYSIDRGWLSPLMVTNPNKMQVELDDCHILISDKTFSSVNDFIQFLEKMNKEGRKNLLIIAEDVQGDLLKMLIVNHIQGIFHTVVVKKPHDDMSLEDIATFTGANSMLKDKGMVLPNVSFLGHAEKVIVSEDSTHIIGGGGVKDDIENLKSSIRDQIETVEEFEKDRFQKRLARLNGRSVVIKVGAPTEPEARHLKDKLDDAVNATKAAKDGIIPGGGVTLLKISAHLEGRQNKGSYVVAQAIRKPFEQIMDNAALLKDGWLFGEHAGIDVTTGKVVSDMFEAGIIDPVKVTRTALKNAASLATGILTMESATVELFENGHESRGMPVS